MAFNLNVKIALLISFIGGGLMTGCKSQTPMEKAKVEDAQHEIGQSVERAGDQIKKSAD